MLDILRECPISPLKPGTKNSVNEIDNYEETKKGAALS